MANYKNKPIPLKDERHIAVYSALGGYCGRFVWPTSDIRVIKVIAENSKHFEVHICECKGEHTCYQQYLEKPPCEACEADDCKNCDNCIGKHCCCGD